MNYRIVSQIAGRALGVEGLLLLFPTLVAAIYGEPVMPFLTTAVMAAVGAALLTTWQPPNWDIYAREGFVSVAVTWILLGIIGAFPFFISGEIPNYIDALFETVSGFTTTGASILPNIEELSHGMLFWRSFTTWIGGMGVLVLLVSVMPLSEAYSSIHIMRAEIPGPSVGKIVPKARNAAFILYYIYTVLTVTEIVLLVIAGMPMFDAFITAFGTAGTGGYSNHTLSIGYYNSIYIEMIAAVFMLIFGTNLNIYYLLFARRGRDVLKNEELWWYLGIVVFVTATVAIALRPVYGGVLPALHTAFFQVSSIITTTGFITVNFDVWPNYARFALVMLMFVGACSGSTGGGIKISRIVIIIKAVINDLREMVHPRSVQSIRLNGSVVDRKTIHAVQAFFSLYILLIFAATLLLAIEDYDLVTTITAVITCFQNVGLGLGVVGPIGNFAFFSEAGKILLMFCMLLGRLEIFPIVMLFAPGTWKRN